MTTRRVVLQRIIDKEGQFLTFSGWEGWEAAVRVGGSWAVARRQYCILALLCALVGAFARLLGVEFQSEASQECEEPNCRDQGMGCYLPDYDGVERNGEPDEFYCPRHAFAHGYCRRCGDFFAGVTDFEWGNGICENCRDNEDDDEDDSNYEDDGIPF